MKRNQLLMLLMGGGGISYTLQDTFSTDRAAGSVNGTPAEPTGQARTVADAESKLSITGGVQSYSGGKAAPAWGDPKLTYPSITRVAGLVFAGTITPAATTSDLLIGLGNAAVFNSPSIINCLNFSSSSRIFIIVSGGENLLVAVYTATTYQFAIVLRTSGIFVFIKGGAFTLWTLIWVSVTSSTATLFPGDASFNAAFTADNIRIPVPIYIPAPFAYDTFTRANGALGSTETVSPDGLAIAALVWNFTGAWLVSGNTAIVTPTTGSDVIVNGGFGADTDWNKGAGWSIAAGVASASAASSNLSAAIPPLVAGKFYLITYTVSAFAAGLIAAQAGAVSLPNHGANGTYIEIGLAFSTSFLFVGTGFTGSLDNVSALVLTTAELFSSVSISTADVIAEVAITLPGGNVSPLGGLVLNLDSISNPQNFILCYLNSNGGCVLVEYVAGVPTLKQSTAVTYSAAAILRVVRNGTECRVFYNNAAVGTVQTMTANVNKNHGLFSTRAGINLDSFAVWARGTSGEYEAALNPL